MTNRSLSEPDFVWHEENTSAEALEDILTKIEYAHGIANLITQQRDFSHLPAHQQSALMSLTVFTHEALCAASNQVAKKTQTR